MSIGSAGVGTVRFDAGSMTNRKTGIPSARPTPPPSAQVATLRNARRSPAGSSLLSAMAATVTDAAGVYALPHRAFFALLILFAFDAQRGFRTRFETLLADGLLADFA